ncbi:hypothetical protein Kfla_5020 [Kribbella flavida DSM 17836]|uniref:Uncharacterized protein n=1 Tax=Kribbella flavida (strain DSM 17836 / JCM 10339 / NBRC 14399) TaxID=479435 RepID=D2Q3B3_KRIFD|nr:hypothetical protein [Kribbella flavida]ADB34036.1 hypothetical protein Kfla_5020 [Kribbella flavida DSM 17836]
MPYTADKPKPSETSEQLRARIPGWGADLDPADRPSVPREVFDPHPFGATWDFPERQQEKWPRERSIEHEMLTPVFGTSCPPRGVSGAIRKLAYRRYSEGRAAHWLLLIAADRVDAVGSTARSFVSRHPDNLIAETGVLSEFKYHGIASRRGQKRADLVHQPLDPIIVAGPWILTAVVGYRVVRRLTRRSHD